MRDKIVSLQVLRFLACTGVILCHALVLPSQIAGLAHPSTHFWQIGAAGVDVFFVISGFIIARTGPLATPRPKPLVFFWRRWSRVAPLFFILTIIQVSILRDRLEWTRTLSTVLFWPVYGRHIAKTYIGNGWTLSFEMLFYGAVALYLCIPRRSNGLIIASLFVAGLILLRVCIGGSALHYIVNPVFLEFGVGVILALNWEYIHKVPIYVGVVLVIVAVGSFMFEAFVGTAGAVDGDRFILNQGAFHRDLVFGMPAAALVTGVLIVGREWGGKLVRPFEYLGDASYSLYLTHPLFNSIISGIAQRQRLPEWRIEIVSVALAFASGLLIYRTLERPLRAWLRTIGRTPQPAIHNIDTHRNSGDVIAPAE